MNHLRDTLLGLALVLASAPAAHAQVGMQRISNATDAKGSAPADLIW